MQHAPMPRNDGLKEQLAAADRTLDWLATDDGNPHSAPNIARHGILEAAKIVPHHYRHALPGRPEVRHWINTLAATALEDQRAHGRLVAAISHGPSLLLLGPTGVGKTHEAYGALRALAATGIAARWAVATAANLYAQMRPRHGIDPEEVYERHATARLLLIDDLGAGRAPTEFTEEINFRLIDHRYENHLPTLITTNVLPRELPDRLGGRVASRLAEMCQRVAITGPDRRRGEAA